MSAKNGVTKLLAVVIQLLILLVIVLIAYKASTLAYNFGYRIYGEKPVSEAPGIDIEVKISKGITSADLALLLEKKGLIRDDFYFKINHKFSSYADSIKEGNYILNTSMSMEEMMIIMSDLDV